MANRAGKKCKKPLQTTLGKANCQNEKVTDLSHLQKPLNTSIFGLKQVLSLFQTATKEVQNYITYECDIMYECRTCKTIFRSLANFILHKRNYCRERFCHLDVLNNNNGVQETVSENTSSENADELYTSVTSEKSKTSNPSGKKSLLPVIDRLKEKQEICQLAQEVINQDLSVTDAEELIEPIPENKNNELLLEEIATNNAAVFQTVLQNLPKRDNKQLDFMKSEVMEIHGILDSDEAVLGPDGKICTFGMNKANKIIPKNNLFCTQCNMKFSTKKTLTYHIKYKHNNSRLVYVCPDCKDTFANAWCVYRHLLKVHRRTSAQIKRMREQIHNSCIRKDQEPTKKKEKKSHDKVDKTDEENQWLSNIEGDNDFQMCGGCGKRFERKAALHSHAQMCTKRIAVCNTIKENNAKKKEEESGKDTKNKATKLGKTEVLKGSSKRKPYLLRMYKSNETECEDTEELLYNEECDDNCDVNATCEIVESSCDNNKDVTEKEIRSDEHSSFSSSEDILSPSKSKDFVSSPSIEKIDTEKMLHIIGIPNPYEDKKNKAENNSKCLNDDQKKPDKDHSKESTRSHTASDFDLFCQSVANSLLTDSQETVPGDIEDCSQRPHKTIPLILRRKTSKCEKKNSILEKNDASLQNNLNEKETSDESNKVSESDRENVEVLKYTNKSTDASSDKIDVEEPPTVVNDNVESETIANTESGRLDGMQSSSNFKISVKSLEDLIGVSPRDHMRRSEIEEVDLNNDVEVKVTNDELSDFNSASFIVPKTNDDSSSKRSINLSPDTVYERHSKCLKRRRTSSLDSTKCNKIKKTAKTNVDISFISKASPYMDQDKLLCIPCQITYSSLSMLLWHMSAHFSWFRFQCSRCSFISFNKFDCADHARKIHLVKKASIQSVVLPIPNWKTVLMSHDFSMLSDDSDLSGKHTDEILSVNPEEAHVVENLEDHSSHDNNCVEIELEHRLFVESNNVDSVPENDPLETDIHEGYNNSIKQENIDVIENTGESFQVEVPQEIYTLDVSEILEGIHYEMRYQNRTQIKIEETSDEASNMADLMSMPEENDESFFDEINIKTEVMSDVEPNDQPFTNANSDFSDVESQKCLQDYSNTTVNVRPTRNRTRSIKTIQDDFFYDLSKVIKLNDTSLSKNNIHKAKKALNTPIQKNSKSSSSKGSESKQLRVYSKKK